MSVNLDKNRNAIVAAWKDVIDDKSKTDWALFGYEPHTNDLKVVSTGDGGLDELNEDLNTSNIMYAFVRVNDAKTSLTKYVLINWQGEGAQTVRKGTCANHINDISKLLTGAHLTINARNEDEMEPALIMEKISSVGSAYSFKEPRMHQEEQRGPVGTNYSRVIPAKEINSKDRDNFWKKEEEEERRRVELDKERRQQELIKAEKERKHREEKEHNDRERRIASELKSPTVNAAPQKSIPQPLSPSHPQLNPVRTMTQAEEMRQKRNHEAKELIGSRVGTAKAIFSQNSSSGQMQTSINKAAPAKPVRNSIAQRINSLNNPQLGDTDELHEHPPSAARIKGIIPVTNVITETDVINEEEDIKEPTPQIIQNTNKIEQLEIVNGSSIKESSHHLPNASPEKLSEEQFEDDGDQYSTIKRSPYTKTNSSNSQVSTPVEPDPPQQLTSNTSTSNSQMTNSNDMVTEDDIIYQDIMKDGGLKARALYDYQAADESEITFDPGDIITHIDQIDEGWWQGLGPDGAYGLFPANYVQIIQ